MRYNPLKPDQNAPKQKTDYQKTIPTPRPISHAPTLMENSRGGFDLRFPSKPSPEILAAFHATQQLGRDFQWHWHWKQKVWYAKRNDTTRAFAAVIISGTPPCPVSAPEQRAAVDAPAAPIPAIVAANVIPVDFAAAPAPSVPVPAWRSRFLRGKV